MYQTAGARLFIHENPAQRWFMFQNMGPSPSGRSGHAMASSGTRVFVLGGESAAGSQTDESALIHVLDTSTCSLSPFHSDNLQILKIQSTSSIRNPTLTPNLVTKPSSRVKPRPASRPRSNHNHKRCPLHQGPTRHVQPLPLTNPPTLRSCAALSPRKMCACNAPFRTVCHHNPRL